MLELVTIALKIYSVVNNGILYCHVDAFVSAFVLPKHLHVHIQFLQKPITDIIKV